MRFANTPLSAGVSLHVELTDETTDNEVADKKVSPRNGS
jgi:hypothetical protein